ncbi:hypothetical protein [Vreelandella stevensii]|uniref:hypothetical protein n=1 Tax=Vreelandella stevensii TaxID=502821 RepID=UPI00374A6F14
MYEVLVDFIPLVVALFSALFLSRQIWLYLLKDAIVEKISEVQATKKRTRGLASSGLFEYREKVSSCGLSLVTASDLEDAKDLFSDIHIASVHSSNALATVAHISKFVFSNVSIADVESWNYFDGETKSSFLGMRRQDFYSKVIAALSLIESKAIRSIEMPKGISVSSSKFMPYALKGYFSGQGVRYIKGMGQGSKISPLDVNTGEFFVHVIGFFSSEEKVIFAKRYFQVLGGNNSFFLPYFLEEKLYAPMSIDFPSGTAISRTVSLISLRNNVSFIGGQKSVGLVYGNLTLGMSFFEGIDKDKVMMRFEEVAGIKPKKVYFNHRHDCFEVFFDLEELVKLYEVNYYKVISGYWRNSVESSFYYRLKVVVFSFFGIWLKRLFYRR